MAEFDLSRLWGDYGYDEERNCWWASDPEDECINSKSKRSPRRTSLPSQCLKIANFRCRRDRRDSRSPSAAGHAQCARLRLAAMVPPSRQTELDEITLERAQATRRAADAGSDITPASARASFSGSRLRRSNGRSTSRGRQTRTLSDARAEQVDGDHGRDDDDDLRRRLGVLEAADAFVEGLADAAGADDAERVAERTLVSRR